MAIPQEMKFNDQGLIVAIVQDVVNNEILMQAFMNEESLRLTIETGIAHYYSRSRNKLWKKGESSGHLQHVKEMRIDCDLDAVVMKVEQVGGACHVGFRSCFYRVVEKDGSLRESGEKVFDPKQAYNK
ncbi:phosphoribosyl-AMP cyclohydrolase [bacterium]|nr:phosphoribosyl-AMP cyclohydrolase [bacterium]